VSHRLSCDPNNDNPILCVTFDPERLTNTRAFLTDTAYQNGLTGVVAAVEGTVLQPRTVGLSLDAKL
jgi:hypothetical protein